MFFTNAKSLIVKGRSRVIDVSDRLDLPDEINPKIFTWDENKVDWSNGKTIYFSLFRQTKIIIIKAVIFQIVGSLFAFATPLLIHEFIEKLQTNDWSEQNIFYLITLAIGFGLCGAGNGVSIQHYFYQILSFYQIATNLINKKLFSHSLKISNSAKQKYQIGDVVNFMSSDAEAIGDAAMTTIDLVNAVVLLVGCSTLLFYYLGWSALVAIFVMIILVPMTQLLAKKFIIFQDEMMSYRDQRMTLLTQVLSAIRVVKYFSWEKSVAAEVDAIRGLEIKSRVKLAKAEVAWGLIYASISSVVLFSALVTHYLRGFEIKLSLVLTCLAIFSIMEDHFGGLSRFIGRFISIFVSGDRMASYISSDVILSEENVQKAMDEGVCVDCRNVDFSYDGKNKLFQKLNFKIELGQSVAVVGPVGIGKSTLLQLLLHELYPQAGQVSMLPLKKAYVSQETFIINTSLKENIIFGHGEAVDPNLLDKAIEYSCLKYDLQLLDHQLDTEIGERGVNLSGGQKQRVSLARAIYSQADIILMDDPLSAVDPDTEDKLSRELIFGLWNSKTRIVVTHRIAHIKNYDRILFLQNDHYKFGTYEELYNNSEEFRKFLDLEIKNKTDEDEIKEKINQIPPLHSESTSSGRVTVDEDRATGSVDKAVYFSYLKALGGDSKYRYLNLIILFLSTICAVAFTLIQKAWLTQMATKVSTDKLVIGYGLFGLSVIFVSFLSNSFWAYRGVMAGRRFHQNMMKSILSARIRFFDSTPIGRILQRFSRDIEFVDLYVQWDVSNAINALFNILTSTLLIVVTVPITILLLSPALIYFYFVQRDYRHVAREIKRLDSLARSPKYAHFKETLNGLQVIRSYSQQKWFTKEFLTKITNSTQMFYTHYMLNRWFSTRLPMIGGVISIVASISVVFATKNNYIGAGLAGLITLYALDFWRHLNWGVRIFSDLESKMTSVERLEYYANLPAERDSVAISDFEKNQDYKSWPRTGDLEFKNVYLKYADHLPFVLKNVSFKIKSGLRVGIIGRTGSGKSTLFQAVYRFVDYQSGDILIDGLSIQSVPLERLRKNLAVIPQDPSLFMGSLRSNLDRYSEKTDTEIWDVLHKVGLKPFVENLPLQLSATVTENGSNLSQGQRQLICLARALLMKVKIIFLDEATASIDLETDALVQKVIRESLSGITLVTIAHRIATLKDYDQIIELQNGQVMR